MLRKHTILCPLRRGKDFELYSVYGNVYLVWVSAISRLLSVSHLEHTITLNLQALSLEKWPPQVVHSTPLHL